MQSMAKVNINAYRLSASPALTICAKKGVVLAAKNAKDNKAAGLPYRFLAKQATVSASAR